MKQQNQLPQQSQSQDTVTQRQNLLHSKPTQVFVDLPDFNSTNDGFIISETILGKVMRRVAYRILEHELEKRKTDYCVDDALSSAFATVDLYYDLAYDIGDYLYDDAHDEDFDEPMPAINDVYATQCLPSNTHKPEVLRNLYDEDLLSSSHHHHHGLTRRQILHELEMNRRKHLVIKHGSANVVGSVGEPWASEGVVKIRDPRLIEADDELAMIKRREKDLQRLKAERAEKEAKEKIVKDKQRMVEIDNVNKELDKGHFTYDFQGNIIIQNAQVAETIPPDFKFKYKFKKGLKKGSAANSKKQIVPFRDNNKQSGFISVDTNKLSKLVEQPKGLLNVRQTAGSMFEFFKPPDAGVSIKEQNKVKASKKEIDEVPGKMSLDTYHQKINVQSISQLTLRMMPPSPQNHILVQENNQDKFTFNYLLGKSPLIQTMALTLKQDVNERVQEHKEQQEFINKLKQEYKSALGPDHMQLSDKHMVVMKSPESINQLIVFPNNNSSKFGRKLQMTKSMSGTLGAGGSQASNQSVTESIQDEKRSQLSYGRRQILQRNSSVKEMNIKTIEVTGDLFKLQKEQQQKQQMQNLFSSTVEYKSLQNTLNSQLLTKGAWGNSNDGLPSLLQKSSSSFFPNGGKTQASFHNYNNRAQRLNTASNGQQMQSSTFRPFSRASNQSSQQSLRGALTTANSSTNNRRRKIMINPKSELQHLAPPPLGKTTGHGLITLNQQFYNTANSQQKNTISKFENDSHNNSTIAQEQKRNANLIQMIGIKNQKPQPSQQLKKKVVSQPKVELA